jgi:hypothetical protein
MPEREPSYPREFKPVNRIALWAEYGLLETVGIHPSASPIGSAGSVFDPDRPANVTDIVPALTRANREEFDLPSTVKVSIYLAVYDDVRSEIAKRKPPEEIRAFFLQSVRVNERERPPDIIQAIIEGTVESVEDALAARPIRYKLPFGA